MVEISPRKAWALLIYLVVTQQPHSRDTLAALFWPESDQQAARASLRRTLYRLSQALPCDLVVAGPDTLAPAPNAALWLDIHRYQQQVAAILPSGAATADLRDEQLAALEEAGALYTDDFLAGFSLPDSPAFDEWQFFQGEMLRQSLTQVLEQLVAEYQARGAWEQAIRHARRQLSLDPLHEPAHRQLMQLYAWSGQHAAALRQYRECERVLREEMDVPPEEETLHLLEAIKAKQLASPAQMLKNAAPPDTTGPDTGDRDTAAQVAPPARMRHSLPHQLPPVSTPFVGRQTELAQIRRLLVEEAECRLLTVVGQGGIGKTRLALHLADQLMQDEALPHPFGDGIFFVPLVSVGVSSGIAAAINEAIGLNSYGHASPRRQLLDYLHTKQALLILDSFEHLLDGKELLSAILAAAPGVKLLVTSRIGLNLLEAWFYPVAGLSFPGAHAAASLSMGDYEAVQLFVQCARRGQPMFTLAQEQKAVARICQLVEGMPLGIELAASWLKTLSAADVAAELAHNLDILTTRHQNVPERHRSMRAVLERSWMLLQPAEQAALERLSIFKGGFCQEAAQQVADATLDILATLVEQSLLRRDPVGRYEPHELLRQYAAERLHAQPGAYDDIQRSHSAYYARFLQRRSLDLMGGRQQEALDEIAAELDNLRAAWAWAVAHRDIHALGQAGQGYWLFCHYRGMLHEGESAFASAVAAFTGLEDHGPGDPDSARPRGLLLAGLGWFRARRGEADDGRALMQQGVALLQAAGLADLEMFARIYMGGVAEVLAKLDEAEQIGQQCLDYFSSTGNQWGVATCYELLGSSALGSGRLELSEELLQKSLKICRQLGERRVRLLDVLSLTVIAKHLGDYPQAKRLLDEADSLSEELRDQLGRTVSRHIRGALAVELGDYARAVELIQRSLALAEQIGLGESAYVLLDLGTAYRLQGKFEEAEQIYRKSLDRSQVHNLQVHMAHCLCCLGCIAYERQEYRRAEQLQLEALAKLRAFGNEPEIASALRHLGHTATAIGAARHADARQTYRQALQLAVDHRLAPVALDVFVGVAKLLVQARDARAATLLLSLAEQHSAASHQTRQNARVLLNEMAATLPIHLFTASQPQEWSLDWQEMVYRMLDRLTTLQTGELQAVVTNLPAQPTPFVGREQELAAILHYIQDANCRFLTLVGPGGTGKTRLALHAAQLLVDLQYQQGAFAHGIFFIPLATVNTTLGIVPAIAVAIGLDSGDAMQPRRLLLDYLQDKQLLLVLDDFEHLLDATELLSEILAEAPGVKLLVTSRVGLNLQEGWLYPITGLSYPSDVTGLRTPVEAYEAVRFFVQCARRIQIGFALAGNEAQIVKICRLTEGMPLALELAAGWLKVLAVEAIAQEIERNLDILVSLHRNAPARHRSMRAVQEQSWQLLSEKERTVLARLSIFQGSFRRQAGDQVADASLLVLATLVDKSLLRVDGQGRYQLHELLRQFAAEQLQASPVEEDETRERHKVYYLEFLNAWGQRLTRDETDRALAEIGEEIGNVQIAWRRALAQEDLAWIERTTVDLWRYYWICGRSEEMADILGQALAGLQGSPTAQTHPRYEPAIRVILSQHALCQYFLGHYADAKVGFEQGFALARKLGQTAEAAGNLIVLGAISGRQGRHQLAIRQLQESLALFRESNFLDGVADALHELASVHSYYGDYRAAQQLAAESLAVSRKIGRVDWIGHALDALGWTAFALGDYRESRARYLESLAVFRKAGHQLGIALSIGGLGLVEWAAGGERLQEAHAFLEESLAICRKIGHRLHSASRLAQLAQLANDLGNYPQAQAYAQEGIAIAQELDSFDFLAHLYGCLAQASYGLGETTTCRRYLREALETSARYQFTPRLAIALYHWALIALEECSQADGSQPEVGRKQQEAANLLALVAEHPATWHIFRQRAAARLTELHVQIPSLQQTGSQAHRLYRTLEEAAVSLLGHVASTEWSQA